MSSIDGATTSIRRPDIQVAQLEIKPMIIQMIQSTIQFNGLSREDPNWDIVIFLKNYNTVKQIGITNDAICLRLFPFSRRDKTKMWLDSLAPGTITTSNSPKILS